MVAYGRKPPAALIARGPAPGAGWSSPVTRQAHNLKVAGSNPARATKFAAIGRDGLVHSELALADAEYVGMRRILDIGEFERQRRLSLLRWVGCSGRAAEH